MDAVDEIKARLPIEDVVGRYVDLKRSGSSLKGLCPFHQEKSPSFYVSPQRGTYHCFGCSRGGDVFSFMMEAEHVAFPDALKTLAEQAGVHLPEREERRPSLKNRLYEANEAALRFFRQVYDSPEGKAAAQYLARRGFGRDAIDLFDVGFAPRSGDVLVRRLKEQGFDDRILLAAGVAVQDDIGGRLRDRFRGRLMLPIREPGGKISGFGGRMLGEGQPKYLNSPQTEIFDKSSVLFGIQRAQDAIRASGRAVLVEGYLDAVRAHIGGFLYTVASLGTAVTARQLTALSKLTDTVILALDPDPAGLSAAARTALSALVEATQSRARNTRELDLRIATLPEGLGDPDELIRDHPDVWEEAIEASVPAFEFHFRRTIDRLDHSREEWRQQAIDQLLPAIQQLALSPGRQAIWIERLGAETGVDVRAIQRAMPGAPRQRRTQRQDVVAQTTARALTANVVEEVERGLMALLLQVLVIPRAAREALHEIELEKPEHRALLARLDEWQNYDYELFRTSLPRQLESVADELRGLNVPLPDKVSVAVRLHIARLKRARVLEEERRAREVLSDLPVDEQLDAVAAIARLTGQLGALDRELEELHLAVLQERHGTIDQESGSR